MNIDPFGLRQAISQGDMSREEKLKTVCRQFESMFVSTLFKEMRNTVKSNGLLGENSFGSKVFQEMWDTKMAEEASNGPGLGLSKMLYEQMARTWLAQQGPETQDGIGNGFVPGADRKSLNQMLADMEKLATKPSPDQMPELKMP